MTLQGSVEPGGPGGAESQVTESSVLRVLLLSRHPCAQVVLLFLISKKLHTRAATEAGNVEEDGGDGGEADVAGPPASLLAPLAWKPTLPLAPVLEDYTAGGLPGWLSPIPTTPCVSFQVCRGSPPGVWVCSTDMLLTVPTVPKIDWHGFQGARVIAVPGSVSYARQHGVYLADDQGFVQDILYQSPEDQMQQCVGPDGKVPLVCGIVFFSSSEAAEQLLATHVIPPLNACTYLGLDSGAPAIQLSLFFDILLSMARGVSEEAFVNGLSPRTCSRDIQNSVALRSARSVLWKALHSMPLTMVYIPDGSYDYMTTSASDHIRHLTTSVGSAHGGCFCKVAHSQVEEPQLLEEGCSITNSLLEGPVAVGPGTAVQHCRLKIGSGCLLTGLDLASSEALRGHHLKDVVIQGHAVRLKGITCKSLAEENGTYLNTRWAALFLRTGIRRQDLWSRDVPESCQRLLNAHLFPVLHASEPLGLGDLLWLLGTPGPGQLHRWQAAWRMSWEELRGCLDQEAELASRTALFFRQGRSKARKALMEGSGRSLLPLLRSAVLEGYQEAMLDTLDEVAASASDPGVAARALACIADLLACMAKGEGGLRSGPAANPSWAPAFQHLERGSILEGVRALATERKNWLHRPALLVRAARHYEGAEQILIRQAVMSSCQFVSLQPAELPPLGCWVTVECPARIDFSGGWSDTPPITYEHGGAVMDVAVLVDGQRPIGAQARRLVEPELRLMTASGSLEGELVVDLVCRELEDLRDYCQPHAPGGGWQDQVGGLFPGLKIGRSKAQLPLKVEVEQISVLEGFVKILNEHLLLLYTGKTRLARNLLQDVLRNWYARLPTIVQNTDALVDNAEECVRALQQGDLSLLGKCLNCYWLQKKTMAPGCEPLAVRRMMEILEPLVYGQSLTGAGGGGFLCILTREPRQQELLQKIMAKTEVRRSRPLSISQPPPDVTVDRIPSALLQQEAYIPFMSSFQGLGNVSIHTVEVDTAGIQIHLQGDKDGTIQQAEGLPLSQPVGC
ncbi:hypothetical protein JD844_000008 [Phrynosoma platyrhinos]|uniref:L-fucose kinase n=1 Tax=Phrynosoma platyrhinos TaxID=52577 RepID=A0ABQ7SPY9_PHRPL|nr:hypothetical protein JD844_000008 [Phrynosoma platyrhinos]